MPYVWLDLIMATTTEAAVGLEATKRAEKIREKAGRFRILIIGRANAGKTTILQKVCNSTEGPKIATKAVKVC